LPLNYFLPLNKETTYSLQKEYVNGESFLYLGRNYLLEFVESEEEIKFLNRLYVTKDSKHKAKKLFYKWYREKAKEKITYIIKEFALKMDVSYKEIKFSKMQYQRGSCSVDKTININYNIIKAPKFIITYVVVHELAHIIELNHSNEFWSIIKAQLPQ
jgi:predicted metal-dependent hydrolase